MEKVRAPVFFVEVANRDVTQYVSDHIEQVTYTDAEHGKADEIDVVFDDSTRLWDDKWYPTKGDQLSLRIGYEGEPLLPCGQFQIDSVRYQGAPDLVVFSGVSTAVTANMRQNNNVAYENKTLREIAEEVAERHQLTVVGDIVNVSIRRITQQQERDLAFLKRLAEQYNHVFKVTGDQLVFYREEALRSAPGVATLRRGDVIRWDLVDKTIGTYRACEVSYFDADAKEVRKYATAASGAVVGDVLKLNERCENRQQAELKASSALARANNAETEGTIEIYGDPRLMAGLTLELLEFGRFSGRYVVKTSRHTITKNGGYVTGLEVERA